MMLLLNESNPLCVGILSMRTIWKSGVIILLLVTPCLCLRVRLPASVGIGFEFDTRRNVVEFGEFSFDVFSSYDEAVYLRRTLFLMTVLSWSDLFETIAMYCTLLGIGPGPQRDRNRNSSDYVPFQSTPEMKHMAGRRSTIRNVGRLPRAVSCPVQVMSTLTRCLNHTIFTDATRRDQPRERVVLIQVAEKNGASWIR